MTLRSLISILTLSFASFSAMSFQLPASMISMNSAFAESPAICAVSSGYRPRCARMFSINTKSGRDSVPVGRNEPPRRELLRADAAPVQRCGASWYAHARPASKSIAACRWRSTVLRPATWSSSRRRQTEGMSVSTSVTTGLFTPPAARG